MRHPPASLATDPGRSIVPAGAAPEMVRGSMVPRVRAAVHSGSRSGLLITSGDRWSPGHCDSRRLRLVSWADAPSDRSVHDWLRVLRQRALVRLPLGGL